MSCPDCFTGHIHNGNPKGGIATLHSLETNIAEPTVPADQVKGIIVIIPDVFGWEFVNNRLLADHYAEMGAFRVYLPDFMNGTNHIVTLLYGIVPFFLANRPPKSWPIVESFFSALRQSAEGQALPIGAAGFCWGGKHTVLLAHGASTTTTGGAEKNLIDAGFTGYPSLLEIPTDMKKITIPMSFALAELDSGLKGKAIEEVKRAMEGKEDGEVRVYIGAGHGFCARADAAVEGSGRQAVEAEEQAVEFFRKYFAAASS